MNLIHLHILLNHFPTIGTIIALGLFVCALWRKHDDLKRVSLAIFFLIAVIAFPTYMSGNAAQELIVGRPEVSNALIEAHEDAALLAFILMEITGVGAWWGLWQYRRKSAPAGWIMSAVLILSIGTFVLMARAATMGGEIRHTEIQSGVEPTISWLNTAGIARYVANTPWAWPISEILHFVGLCLLFGVVLLVNLRVLGIVRSVSFPALHRLLPVGILGFVINSVTGMIFFITTPEQYTQNIAFYWKVALMLLSAVSVLYFTVFDEPWEMERGDEASRTTKLFAASTIVLWLGVLYFGRMLPYIGNSF